MCKDETTITSKIFEVNSRRSAKRRYSETGITKTLKENLGKIKVSLYYGHVRGPIRGAGALFIRSLRAERTHKTEFLVNVVNVITIVVLDLCVRAYSAANVWVSLKITATVLEY
uniref:Uncharacterized protein n=1 Tax=Glossina austeni TaxID=7395 RepID=A0A1A9UWG6_GLOAU